MKNISLEEKNMEEWYKMKKEEFDHIIRENLTAQIGQDSFGYVVTETSKEYANYYSNKVFDDFLKEIQSPKYNSIYRKYAEGEGSELIERNGRYGKYPPKMASVASSSRFCFLALRDGAAGVGGSGSVDFEHGCPIKGITGTAPQLDAYIPNENIYVEVKCHEIFVPHRVIMKEKYWNLVCGQDNGFGFSSMEKPRGGIFEIPLSEFGLEKKNSMFDVKQFLCHLLGIASQEKRDVPATLVYLFFKPKAAQSDKAAEIDKIFDALQKEIVTIFHSEPIRRFTKRNDIRLWAAAEYAEVMGTLTADNRINLAGE